MTIDFDDYGSNHIISDMCQAHDCRKELDMLHYANLNFKVTLFAIPGEMTPELLRWCDSNSGWVELAVHGFYHSSNYECEKMSYEEFDEHMQKLGPYLIDDYFVKGFKAPGWQISDGAYKWLNERGWWVADQSYNNSRRPHMPAYVTQNGKFWAVSKLNKLTEVEAWHGHTWNCVGNGIEETYDHVEGLVKNAESFEFVSEVLHA